MTCIVGIVFQGNVMIGADSAGVAGLDKRIRADRKVFRVGEMVMGFTSSFRMGQLLQFGLTPPPVPEGVKPFEYMVRNVVPELRSVLRAGGYMRVDSNREEGGSFLVGFRGRLFAVHQDFQVAESTMPYEAVGCGESYALGALHALGEIEVPTPPTPYSPTGLMRYRLERALNAATAFSAGVASPYHFEAAYASTIHG